MLCAATHRDLTAVISVMTVLMVLTSAPWLYFSHAATAEGVEESLEAEANRLTYEILELKARQRTAQSDRVALLEELSELEENIAGAEAEMEMLDRELEECQRAYELSLRSLYKKGRVSELEVLLEARGLEELWEDDIYYNRIVESETAALDNLRAKISEVDLRGRGLREQREKRQRIAESLDDGFLSARIAGLEARLSEVNAELRSLRGGGGERRPSPPDPQAWVVPAPGKLLDRVTSEPPLSDFERTGMLYAGYTTWYGEEFHGRPTASGVLFNMYGFTCAHRTLPFGTWLLVSFRGRQTIVQVNDRGPFVPGRVLDLSLGAAKSIGLDGVQWTEFEILIPLGG